jgi:3D (Asp-Asp-Asp) domain-containing protein
LLSNSGTLRRLAAVAIAALVALLLLVMLPLVLLAGVVGGTERACQSGGSVDVAAPAFPTGSGDWVATAYGPPWDAMEGSGVTATGIDLRPARPAYVVAVDPTVIPLGSRVHVRPNPFGDRNIVFLAADTGGAILGRHVDIYDWRGRRFQNGWGKRSIDVEVVGQAGTGEVLEQTPALPSTGVLPTDDAACTAAPMQTGPLETTPGERTKVLPDGSAAAPEHAPPRIKRYIAAANAIHTTPYVYGGGHGASLRSIQPSYDCSSSTSYALYAAGMLGEWPETSGELESWGAPGPGHWLTLYANGGHVFTIVAGASYNTAHYGLTVPGGSGPRWSTDTTGQLANDTFVVRHWPGL